MCACVRARVRVGNNRNFLEILFEVQFLGPTHQEGETYRRPRLIAFPYNMAATLSTYSCGFWLFLCENGFRFRVMLTVRITLRYAPNIL